MINIKFTEMSFIYSILTILFICQNFTSISCEHECSNYEDIEVDLKYCGCTRNIKKLVPPNSNILFNQTTCSMDAYNRGMGQKIVGFSLYGDYEMRLFKFNGYLEGVKANLELMQKYYPGWIARLYIDYEIEDPIIGRLCSLACQYSFLDICHVKDLPGTPFVDGSKIFPMNWRYFPTLDPQVDLYVSRDLDSRIIDREHAAVQEWIKSNKSVHVTRDHVSHDFEMVGCCWGTKLNSKNIRLQWKSAWDNGLNDSIMYGHRDAWGPDQIFLKRYVWPWAVKDSIGHDAYYCQKYNNTKPFPTKRKIGANNFVGHAPRYNMTAEPCLSYEFCHPNYDHPCTCTCDLNE